MAESKKSSNKGAGAGPLASPEVREPKKLKPNKGNARKIKHLRFEFSVEEPDPLAPDRKRLSRRLARQGEVVEIPREVDRELGDRHGAFYSDAELGAEKAVPGDAPLAERSDRELLDWLKDEHPDEQTTVAAAEGDPALAQRLLDAEAAATGGDPREGVLAGLAQVIDRAGA